jgi:hypothetical protein
LPPAAPAGAPGGGRGWRRRAPPGRPPFAGEGGWGGVGEGGAAPHRARQGRGRGLALPRKGETTPAAPSAAPLLGGIPTPPRAGAARRARPCARAHLSLLDRHKVLLPQVGAEHHLGGIVRQPPKGVLRRRGQQPRVRGCPDQREQAPHGERDGEHEAQQQLRVGVAGLADRAAGGAGGGGRGPGGGGVGRWACAWLQRAGGPLEGGGLWSRRRGFAGRVGGDFAGRPVRCAAAGGFAGLGCKGAGGAAADGRAAAG